MCTMYNVCTVLYININIYMYLTHMTNHKVDTVDIIIIIIYIFTDKFET